MANTSSTVQAAAAALEEVLRDHQRGPGSKLQLMWEIEQEIGRGCDLWLFDDALHYARNFSERRHDGFGPIVYDHSIDMYGYAGDAITAAKHIINFDLQYDSTRLNTTRENCEQAFSTVFMRLDRHTQSLNNIARAAWVQLDHACAEFERNIADARALALFGDSALKRITHRR